ncbi:YraN family protein [Hydrogenophaga sp.]|uniref:YraN family protein n=1 Tax=Hydrogenophaga sp. TaxID=1904254 RepID=UPI0025C4C382|nr:YraN family protein [Hydrogenophaga sp.]
MWGFFDKRAAGTSRLAGQQAEDIALALLRRAGLELVARNFKTPGRGGGEIDLIMRERDGTLVFVEVRQRKGSGHGGAGASIGVTKQRRIVLAARHFLAQMRSMPACRFDAVLFEGDAAPRWLRAAFDADVAF